MAIGKDFKGSSLILTGISPHYLPFRTEKVYEKI
jgi:hypothetical protein